MMRYFLLIFIIILSSCSSLRPLYGRNNELKTKLSNIEIEEIDTVNGAEIHHNLVRLIGESNNTQYLLKITLTSEVISALAITGSADVVKQNVAQLYNYSLIDKNTGRELNQGKIRIVGSYNSLDSSYNSYTNEKFVKKDLAQTLSEEIYMRLMIYFSSH